MDIKKELTRILDNVMDEYYKHQVTSPEGVAEQILALTAQKAPVAKLHCSDGLVPFVVNEEMLTRAMNKAVEVGLVAKWADEETYLKNWAGMKEVLQSAVGH